MRCSSLARSLGAATAAAAVDAGATVAAFATVLEPPFAMILALTAVVPALVPKDDPIECTSCGRCGCNSPRIAAFTSTWLRIQRREAPWESWEIRSSSKSTAPHGRAHISAMVAAKYVLHLIIGCHPILSPHGCCATKGKISRFATPQTPQAARLDYFMALHRLCLVGQWRSPWRCQGHGADNAMVTWRRAPCRPARPGPGLCRRNRPQAWRGHHHGHGRRRPGGPGLRS